MSTVFVVSDYGGGEGAGENAKRLRSFVISCTFFFGVVQIDENIQGDLSPYGLRVAPLYLRILIYLVGSVGGVDLEFH